MNKTVLVLAVSSALLAWSTHSVAAKPEWAGKGKPDLEEVKTFAEAKKVEGEIDDREKQLDSMIEEKKKKAKKSKNKKDKKKLDKELDDLEDEKEALEERKA